jgi:hypothetical protein
MLGSKGRSACRKRGLSLFYSPVVEVVVDAMWHQQPVGEVAKVVVVDALDIRAVASAAPAISPGQQDAVADHERLAQTQARAVQETAILPSGI